MAKSKTKNKVKDVKVRTENEDLIKRFFIILFIILIIVIGTYFLSKNLVDKRTTPKDEVMAGVINDDITSVGTMLNRPYDEYYVMAYDAEDSEAIFYSALITNYQKEKDAKKIYFCDLGNIFNSPYVASDGKSNPKATSIEDLKFGKVTLIKVKKGKITNYIEDVEQIKATLQ